jgi:hypothetical protein
MVWPCASSTCPTTRQEIPLSHATAAIALSNGKVKLWQGHTLIKVLNLSGFAETTTSDMYRACSAKLIDGQF